MRTSPVSLQLMNGRSWVNQIFMTCMQYLWDCFRCVYFIRWYDGRCIQFKLAMYLILSAIEILRITVARLAHYILFVVVFAFLSLAHSWCPHVHSSHVALYSHLLLCLCVAFNRS